MKLSVIVPVFNSQKYLHRCISSILNQTHKELQLILVDDGSTDDSGRICDSFAENDSRIIVIHQSNVGVSEARNRGLEVATGDFITFVDSDDYIESIMYEELIRLLVKYNADISHCGYKRVDAEGVVLKEVNGTHRVFCQNSIEASNCFLQGKYFNCGIWNKLFKSELFKDIRFDGNLRINEDVVVGFLAFQKAKNIVFCDESYYCYVVHKESACNTVDDKKRILDVIEATKIMLTKCISEKNRITLSNRLFDKKLQLYRWYILNKYDETKKKQIKKEIKNLKKVSNSLNRRSKWNYYLMIYFEAVYKTIYVKYNQIRIPNWDPSM